MEKNLIHKKRNLGKILIITIIVALVLVYFFIPTFNSKVNGIFMLFSAMSIESIAEYIRSFGIYAVLVSFLPMMFQSVAAPLPAFLITFANAAIFGWWKGALLSWTSSMAGAALCFYIGRILGRDAVEKLTSKYAMASVEGFFEKYGKHAILVCRLLPFISFDFISYAAGLTSMGFLAFIVATGVGQLPATVVYSYVGGMLTGGAQMIVTALLILFAITVLVFMFKQIYNERQKKSKK
ncbi:TVP38/TMEM64 family protein [Clostridium sp.]|uniref:TVP38/TMEM64 family protein n=1 Tax=Clostridium sp. TaxID=1506 RepID=UPI003217A6F0